LGGSCTVRCDRRRSRRTGHPTAAARAAGRRRPAGHPDRADTARARAGARAARRGAQVYARRARRGALRPVGRRRGVAGAAGPRPRATAPARGARRAHAGAPRTRDWRRVALTPLRCAINDGCADTTERRGSDLLVARFARPADHHGDVDDPRPDAGCGAPAQRVRARRRRGPAPGFAPAVPPVPPLAQAWRDAPLDLTLPHWEDDPTFDLDYHVRVHALAGAG